MAYICRCGTLWTRFRTNRKYVAAKRPERTCPDCARVADHRAIERGWLA